MTKQKARKHLQRSREHLQFWQEQYISNEREENRILDIKLMGHDQTLRQERRAEALQEIKEAKERIARFERIAL